MRAEFFRTTNTCRITFEQLPDPFASQPPPSGRQQQEFRRWFPSLGQDRPFPLKIVRNSCCSWTAERNQALLVTLAVTQAVTVFEVDISGTKSGEF